MNVRVLFVFIEASEDDKSWVHDVTVVSKLFVEFHH